MEPDVTQSLKNAENALRDFIAYVLIEQYGSQWEKHLGVTADRIAKWRGRANEEAARQRTGAVDPRLMYFADFYDLTVIIKKNWEHFKDALGDLKETEVFLSVLGRLRDPDAHRRELLPHQKELVAGISGELRTRIARHRSMKETSDAYYPRIEFFADNFGNVWTPNDRMVYRERRTLRVGDTVELVCSATDPRGEDVEYQYTIGVGAPGHTDKWKSTSSAKFIILESHVGKSLYISVKIRSPRRFHAFEKHDDSVDFLYEVLPPE